MSWRATSAALLCLLAGCGIQEKRFENAAKEWVTAEVNDPEPLEFRELKVIKRSTYYSLCGELNAKSRSGGHAGWTRFVVASRSANVPKHSASGIIESAQNKDIFAAAWKPTCAGSMESH